MEAKELDEFLESEAPATDAAQVLKSKKAYAALIQYVSDDILSTLQSIKTAAGIWIDLKEQYDGAAKETVNQILTRKRLMTVKKTREVSMREHLDHIAKLASGLKASGATVSDADIIVYILMSLPKEYETTKTVLETMPQGLTGVNLPQVRAFTSGCRSTTYLKQEEKIFHVKPDAWEIQPPLPQPTRETFSAPFVKGKDIRLVNAEPRLCAMDVINGDTSRGIAPDPDRKNPRKMHLLP